MRKKNRKEFVIPMAPSDTPNDFSSLEDFSVDDGGGVLTKVSLGEEEHAALENKVEKKNKQAQDSMAKNGDTFDFEVVNKKEIADVSKKLKKDDFVCFKQLYASKDGKLRFYEDADGHIIAVDASKLA